MSLLAAPAVPGQENAEASSSTAAPASSLTKEKRKKHHLSPTTDPLLGELRDLNFSSVGRKLNQVARRLDDDYKVRVCTALLRLRAHARNSSGIKRRRSHSCGTLWVSSEVCSLNTRRCGCVSAITPGVVCYRLIECRHRPVRVAGSINKDR